MMSVRLLAIAASVAAALGCGAESDPPQPPSTNACEAPNRIVGERCLEPGTQDDGCPAGTLGQPDGSCRPAGMLAEDCADGFEHVPFEEQIEGASGAAGYCEPVLPAAPCPPGQMAVPGESACHTVMPCGAGKWGDIPVDAATVYVDGSYAGSDSDGSSGKPWISIAAAVMAAVPGALIAVAAGSYSEVRVDKPVRLWGKCPDEVVIVATGQGPVGCPPSAMCVISGASGSEVRGFAFTGNANGLSFSGVEDVVVENVWVHDASEYGVDIEDGLGVTSITLRSSLVEDNHNAGVLLYGASSTFEDVVIRRTLPQLGTELNGLGLSIQRSSLTDSSANLVLQNALVEENHGLGILVNGSNATLDRVVVRRTEPRATDQELGIGIFINRSVITGALPSVVITSSLVEDNHDHGVLAYGADATLDRVVVRRTLPRASDQYSGAGIGAQQDPAVDIKGTLLVRRSLVEDSDAAGVILYGADATLEGLVVRNALPPLSEPSDRSGIGIQILPETGMRSFALVTGSVIDAGSPAGVRVVSSDATLSALLVQNILPIADGSFGDGVEILSAAISSEGIAVPATAVVTHCRIEQSVRAGLVNFGAHVTMGQNRLSCNGFDLDGEVGFGLAYTFDNLGGNGCGCPDPTAVCTVQSSGIAPPSLISDVF